MSERREYFGFSVAHNDRKQGKQPDYRTLGTGTISPEVVAYIAECHALGQAPKLEMVGWLRTSKAGSKYQSFMVDIHWQEKKDRQNNDPRPPAPRREAPRTEAKRPSLPGLDDDGDIPF